MSSLHGFGLGIVSVNAQGETLDTYYPAPIANVNGDEASALREVSGRLDARQLRELSKTHQNKRVRVTVGPGSTHSVDVVSLLNTCCKGNAARRVCQSHQTADRLIIQLSAAYMGGEGGI